MTAALFSAFEILPTDCRAPVAVVDRQRRPARWIRLIPNPTHAVVLGGGLAGMLTASVLSDHFDHVTIVERDVLPTRPDLRPGVPQARHAHVLMSGGARVVDRLLPGTTDRLIAAGAHRIGAPDQLVALTSQGWLRRYPEMQFMITCSRPLLDWVVHRQVLRDERITLRENTEGVGLIGDATAVTAALVEDRARRRQERLDATIVVDTTGRGSKVRRWLVDLGLPDVTETSVDSGLAYATRAYQAPRGAAKGFPVVNINADPRAGRPGRSATLVPIEDCRWLITLAGTRGGEPTTDEDEFVDFARSVRHPIVGELIADARPQTPVYGSRSTANRRLFFERMSTWPDGLLVLGDAVATFNPVYGHGMSVAAHGAAAVDQGLRHHGTAPGAARRIQREVAKTVDDAWTFAISQDIRYPNAIGKPLSLSRRVLQRYLDRLILMATGDPVVARAVLDTLTLSVPMSRLIGLDMLLAVLRRSGVSALDAPPITSEELSKLAT